jgi:hypothetical protein
MPRITTRHALSCYESVVRLTNSRVNERTYLDLAFCFLPVSFRRGIIAAAFGWAHDPVVQLFVPEEVFENGVDPGCRLDHQHAFTCVAELLKRRFLIGGMEITSGSVAALQNSVWQAVDQILTAGGGVGRGSKFAPAGFVIGKRRPFTSVTAALGPDAGMHPLLNDLQDAWLQLLVWLLRDLNRAHPRRRTRNGRRELLPFRPLLRCPGPPPRHLFFRPGGARQVTCGRSRCKNLRANQRRRRQDVSPPEPD